eukprot:s1250_g9.t1
MKFDLEMAPEATPEEVHDCLKQAAEQLTHAQEVTISKFHLWNLKFGACRRLWSFLKKIYTFRKVQQGSEDIQVEDPHAEEPIPTNNSLEELAARLKVLQKSRHTLDLVCDIFSDFRVRKLGYMCLSWLLVRSLDTTLTTLEELWQHGKQWGWDYTALHAHIFRLADSLVSSKESVEDLFGKGADLKRLRSEIDPRVTEAEKTGPLPDLDDVKPASHTAEFRSVGAMIGLRSGLGNASGLWVGKLLCHGCVYYEAVGGKYILSFGFHAAGGLSWEISPVGPTDASGNHEFFSLTSDCFSPEDSRARLQCFSTTKLWSPSHAENEEEYAGCPWEAPDGGHGILLRRTGPNEPLVRFWLKFGELDVKQDLSKLVKHIVLISKVKVVRHKEKTAGLRFSLIGHYFPDLPEDKKEDLLLRWVPPANKDAVPAKASPGGFYAPYLGDVLQKLHHEEDGKDFQQLKDVVEDYKRQEFVLSRDGSGEPSKDQVEEALKLAEDSEKAGDDNPDDDVVEIPKDVMEVKQDKAVTKSEKEQKEPDPDSDMTGVDESSGKSSSSSSSSSSSQKKKPSKAKVKAEPKNKGRGRGRGRGKELDVPKSPATSVSRKRPQPIDTSNVKVNESLKSRLDQISQENAIAASSSSSSKQPAAKRLKR